MSYLVAAPEFLASAATDLSNIGSTLSAAKSAAAAPTTGVLAAAEDEVSAAVAALFAEQGQALASGQEGFPREGSPQALDRGELGLGVALDLQGTVKEVGVVLLEPDDLMLFAGRAEEAR